jgi:hypothetical protein
MVTNRGKNLHDHKVYLRKKNAEYSKGRNVKMPATEDTEEMK